MTESKAMGSAREIDMERFVLIAQGHSAFQLLWAGVELGLFDLLSKQPNSTKGQLATAMNLAPYPCRVLLTGLTALGLIVKSGEQFRNSALAEALLVLEKPDSIAPVLGWQAHIVYPGLQDFLESLRAGSNVALRRFAGHGNTLYERLVSYPELEQIFQRAMSALSAQANRRIVEAYDLGRFTHIVDAGGGDGTNAIALAKRYPNLRVTVYDRICLPHCEGENRRGRNERPGVHLGRQFPGRPVSPASTPFSSATSSRSGRWTAISSCCANVRSHFLRAARSCSST
ncbi:MAG: hypothetical protein IPO75_03720 [Betaproteobacteria bacterium]|nr:hypothetical protein [Betaproteobacteria bacterium]